MVDTSYPLLLDYLEEKILDAMALNLKKYNPGFLSDDELFQSFCVRTNEFESIVETLQENTGNSNQHILVIGPRGSGKTTLLLRVAIEIRRDNVLSSRLFPIVFSEESYEVSTCGEFWLECLDRLATQVSTEKEREDMRRTWEELQTVQDDQVLAERCLGVLLDFADREGKRLALVVENMNMIFRDAADADTGWRLRKTLQTEPRIMLLASATSRFEEIDNTEQALYDFFRILALRPLSSQECATLWETVSGHAPVMGKIRSLEILTGSNPRLLAIIAGFGGTLSFRELMKDLFHLIDEHTEYFRSHIESLSAAQERRVYLALARLWKPATTREIANLARMETSQCSAQLRRLIERGVVEEKGGTPRRKRYYLTERLYNIYYLLRNGGSRKIVQELMQFMVAYYSDDELKEIIQKVKIEMQKTNIDSLIQINDIYGKFIQSLDKYTNIHINEKEQYIFNLMDKARQMSDIENYDSVVDICNEIEKIYDEIINDTEINNSINLNKIIATILMNKSIALTYLNRETEAIIVCDEILERFSEDDTSEIIEIIAQALLHKANLLTTMDNFIEAIDLCNNLIDKFMNSNVSQIIHITGMAAANKGLILWQSIQPSENVNDLENVTHYLDDKDACKRDVQVILVFLSEIDDVSAAAIRALLAFSISLGYESLLALIQEYSLEDLLLPLVTVFRQEIGQETEVSEEVFEIAQDIRKGLAGIVK